MNSQQLQLPRGACTRLGSLTASRVWAQEELKEQIPSRMNYWLRTDSGMWGVTATAVRHSGMTTHRDLVKSVGHITQSCLS